MEIVVPEHMKGARLLPSYDRYEITEDKAKEVIETGIVIYVKNKLKEELT